MKCNRVLCTLSLLGMLVFAQPTHIQAQYLSAEVIKDQLKSLQQIDLNTFERRERAMLTVESAMSYRQPLWHEDVTRVYYKFWRSLSFEQPSDSLYLLELKRIMPIVAEGNEKAFMQLFQNKDRTLGSEIVKFWEMEDPIASTEVNERLIEHWERIHYSRKHFTVHKNTVYDSDERGEIYVRYGKPDIQRMIESVVTHVTDINSGFRNPLPNGNILQFKMEVWKYNRANMPLMSFYFGDNADTGKPWGVYRNPIDLLPEGGMHFSQMNANSRQQMRAMHRLAALEELSRRDTDTAIAYENVVNEFFGMGGNRNKMSPAMYANVIRQNEVNFDRMVKNNVKNEPTRFSTEYRETQRLPLDIHYYRFMEPNGDPLYVINTSSDPADFEIGEQKLGSLLRTRYEGYSIVHALRGYDMMGNRVEEQRTSEAVTNLTVYPQRVYSLNPAKNIERYVAFQEILNPNRLALFGNPSTEADASRKAIVTTSGPVTLTLPEPLKTSGFQVSDVMLGYKQDVDLTNRIPIIPAANLVFRNNEEVMVYFEVYNPPASNYVMNLSVRQDRLIGEPKILDKANVSLNVAMEGTSDRQFFLFQLDNYQVGKYTFIMEFTSGREKITREIPVRVIR